MCSDWLVYDVRIAHWLLDSDHPATGFTHLLTSHQLQQVSSNVTTSRYTFTNRLVIIHCLMNLDLLNLLSPSSATVACTCSCNAAAIYCHVCVCPQAEKSCWREQLYADLSLLGKVTLTLCERLRRDDMWSLFVDVECRLIPLLACMETVGVTVSDRDRRRNE